MALSTLDEPATDSDAEGNVDTADIQEVLELIKNANASVQYVDRAGIDNSVVSFRFDHAHRLVVSTDGNGDGDVITATGRAPTAGEVPLNKVDHPLLSENAREIDDSGNGRDHDGNGRGKMKLTPSAAKDLEVVDRVLAGDREAFGALVLKYQNRLYSGAVHICGDRDEANDVVQDAFVQAFNKLDTFRRTACFYTWLYRIMYNISISRRRRRKHHSSVDAAGDEFGEQPTDDSGRANHWACKRGYQRPSASSTFNTVR